MSMFDHAALLAIVAMKMPYGKYEGYYLMDLPCSYVEWFARKGFPHGRLGQMLQTVYEIQSNGLEDLVRPLCVKNKR